MSTKTRKKSAGKKAPAKKATAKKSTAKKATRKKSGAKASGRKAAGKRSSPEPTLVELDPRPHESNGKASPAPGPEPQDAGLGDWGELINRVRDVVDPYAADEIPGPPRIQDAPPIGRWIAASFLAGCLVGWILASIL